MLMPSSSGFLPKGDMPVGGPWDIYALVVMATGFGVVALVLLSSGGKLAVLEAWSCDDGLVARREEARPSESLIHSTIKSAQSLLTSHAARRADHPSPPRARGICPPHLTCQDVSGECGGRVRRQRGLLSESPRIRPLKITLGLQYGGGGSVRIIRCVFFATSTYRATVLTLISAATGFESRNACDRPRW